MELEIRGQNIELTEALRGHVEKRLGFALGRFRKRLSRVTVRLIDVNGPRGGVDKRCKISLEGVHSKKTVIIEDTDVQLSTAIDRAADRLSRMIQKEIEKEHSLEMSRVPRWAKTNVY